VCEFDLSKKKSTINFVFWLSLLFQMTILNLKEIEETK